MTSEMTHEMTPDERERPAWWGMAGVFPGALGVYEGDPWRNKLDFVADRGFHGSGVAAGDLDCPRRREELGVLAEERGQQFFVHHALDPGADPAEYGERLRENALRQIACGREIPLPVAQFVVKVGWHRFRRDLPLAEQLERLALLLKPAVGALAENGVTPVIENHGDYHVSDLVGLCGAVPGLKLLLDTGNCFLIGERPDQIPDDAFPLVAATHFKDHHAFPDHRSLAFRLTGATLGAGDVGLDRLFGKLLHLHPEPAAVRMMVEWVPDPDKDAIDCLNASLDYLSRLSGGAFQNRRFEP